MGERPSTKLLYLEVRERERNGTSLNTALIPQLKNMRQRAKELEHYAPKYARTPHVGRRLDARPTHSRFDVDVVNVYHKHIRTSEHRQEAIVVVVVVVVTLPGIVHSLPRIAAIFVFASDAYAHAHQIITPIRLYNIKPKSSNPLISIADHQHRRHRIRS